jgi:hypothetical protein
MLMHEIQALILGKIAPQAIKIDHLIELAAQYPNPNSNEYKLIELALNIVLSSYLDKALKHI